MVTAADVKIKQVGNFSDRKEIKQGSFCDKLSQFLHGTGERRHDKHLPGYLALVRS
jgi:hypothetical protein